MLNTEVILLMSVKLTDQVACLYASITMRLPLNRDGQII